MSHFATDSQQQRPTMRRKSSAQNLLFSFKTNTSSSSSSAGLPPPLNLGSSSSAVSSTYSVATAREWDSQSLHSDTVGNNLGGAQSPPLNQGTSVEYLRDLVQKRIITLTYIRNIHEGRSHWFHTILISRSDLDRIFNNNKELIRKRTYRFAILGLSLSSLMEINHPTDLLRSLYNTLSEYEQAREDGDTKSKMRIKFPKPKNSKRGGSSIADFSGTYPESSASTTDASFLFIPSIPFPLDYHQTLLSLLDVLSEVYNKISKLLGPSPFPHSSQHMMGPLGLLSPHPGVSYLFENTNAGAPPLHGFVSGLGSISSTQIGLGNSSFTNHSYSANAQSAPNLQPSASYQSSQSSISGLPETSSSSIGTGSGDMGMSMGNMTMSGSLWEIANASANSSGSLTIGGGFSTPSVSLWTNSLGDLVLKIDGKLKKITSILLKELDELARNGIRQELASLDPLLRNLGGDVGSGPSGPQQLYDFEGM